MPIPLIEITKRPQGKEYRVPYPAGIFVAIFADMAPLVAFVGSNKIHLRRACAIREKGNCADPTYMARLRQEHAQMGFTFAFDDQGRFICTEATCADIIKTLLDHRLNSRLSGNLYDVENTDIGGIAENTIGPRLSASLRRPC